MRVNSLILSLFLLQIRVYSIIWRKCPVYTDLKTPNKNIFFFKKEPIYLFEQKTFIPSSQKDVSTECAEIPLPLDYESNGTSTEQIYIFVKRFIQNKTSNNILWVLPRYSGSSSDKIEYLMLDLYHELTDFDVYYLDHRGVGRSERIGCLSSGGETEGSEEGIELVFNEIIPCRDDFKSKYEEDDLHFSTTYASLDFLEIVKLLKISYPEKKHHLFGVGYGTYWISRILQVDKDSLFVSAIFDSVFSQKGDEQTEKSHRTKIDEWNINFHRIGINFLEFCSNDSFCLKKLSENSQFSLTTLKEENFIRTLTSALFPEDGSKSICTKAKNALQSEKTFKLLIGSMLTHFKFRTLIPSLFYRIIRCSFDLDYGVFDFINRNIKNEDEKKLSRIPYDSIILGMHLLYNEFWSDPIQDNPTEYLENIFKNSSFAYLQSEIGDFILDWPKYINQDKYWKKPFSTNSVKLLLINGELDPLTPYFDAETQFNNIQVSGTATKQIIRVPMATHFVLDHLITKNNENCGITIIKSFLNDPDHVDVSCLEDVSPITFTGDDKHSTLFYGCTPAFDCDYIERHTDLTISLTLFILLEGITCIVFIIIISFILYFLVRKKREKGNGEDKSGYNAIDGEEEEEMKNLLFENVDSMNDDKVKLLDSEKTPKEENEKKI